MTAPPYGSVPPFPGAQMLAEEILTRGVLWRRVVAWMVDAIIVMALWGVVAALLALFGVLTLGLGFPLLSLLPLLPFLYTWLFVASPACATPGQAMMDLSVRSDEDLSRPTPLEALIYTGGYYVTVALGAIWLAVALLTVRHRALHDMVAGVVVVRRRALTGGPPFWIMGGGGTPIA